MSSSPLLQALPTEAIFDSVSLVTDDKASVVNRFEYLPFGESWITEGDGKNRPKFNSQELDAETGYYYFNARYQDPEICRFVTADNVIDGEYSTQGWNRYSYCKNNPIQYKDPTGHWGETSDGRYDYYGDNGPSNKTTVSNAESESVKKQLDKSVGASKGRGNDYKAAMERNLTKINGEWVTQVGGTRMNVSQLGKNKEEILKSIDGTNPNTVAVLGDMAKDLNLRKMTISGMSRDPRGDPQFDPHRYEKYNNKGGGRGVDITSASTRKEYGRLQGLTDRDPSFRQESAPSLTDKITSYLRNDPRTSQVITPWTVVDKSKPNQTVPNRIWNDGQNASKTEWDHRNHIHFGTSL